MNDRSGQESGCCGTSKTGEQATKPVQATMPSADEIKGRWKQHVGAAKIAWGKLTEDELLKLEGHEQKLAGLIQERYAITRDEAVSQVKKFFEKHESSSCCK